MWRRSAPRSCATSWGWTLRQRWMRLRPRQRLRSVRGSLLPGAGRCQRRSLRRGRGRRLPVRPARARGGRGLPPGRRSLPMATSARRGRARGLAAKGAYGLLRGQNPPMVTNGLPPRARRARLGAGARLARGNPIRRQSPPMATSAGRGRALLARARRARRRLRPRHPMAGRGPRLRRATGRVRSLRGGAVRRERVHLARGPLARDRQVRGHAGLRAGVEHWQAGACDL